MMHYMDPDFQRQLDEYNDSRGGPAKIALAYHPEKERWQVFAIPVQDSHHPLARNEITAQLTRPLPDDSGRHGILLNTWQGAQGEYLPLDGRLFEALDFANSFTSKDHFEKTIEEPEMRREMARTKRVMDAATAAKQYWWKLDSIVKSMNPAVRVGGDWRATRPWR